ncbi:DUF2511 domain-containing protein [Bifidobacterium sp. H6bp9]|uniref:DUF2511 domain-containing protein n=1 Tax=Bifidobacterium sp. H6bp9 TaxID=3051961 RepID=UPI0028BE6702|nr:DUF2511 domain-containing protein [Bifidobacterium sp. H6bp9]MDT7510901.1 DUF2511 domain-containing protein [Bifidobacterium sp. H6bp9]
MKRIKQSLRTILLICATVMLTVGVVGCADGMKHPEEYSTDGSNKVAATSNPQTISKEDLGHTWPLKVDEGTVSCELSKHGDPILRFTTSDGAQYALNQVQDNEHLKSIETLKSDKSKSVGTLMSFAFSVCDIPR